VKIDKSDYDEYVNMINIQDRLRVIAGCLFLIFLIFLILLIYNCGKVPEKINVEELEKNDYTPDCGGLSFIPTAICLNEFARENFFYNMTDDSKDLTIKDMMVTGGDCKDYTDFYEKYMKYYGFGDTERFTIFVSREDGVSYYHVFLIANGKNEGYCHMDIEDIDCYEYKNNKGEIKQ
jgi:hypothetical protein